MSTESKGSGIKSRISFSFPHGRPGIDVVIIHVHTVNLISRSYADDSFVRDEDGDGALLRDKVYKVLAGLCPGMTAALWLNEKFCERVLIGSVSKEIYGCVSGETGCGYIVWGIWEVCFSPKIFLVK